MAKKPKVANTNFVAAQRIYIDEISLVKQQKEKRGVRAL
jgi:hypothetical protein